MWNFHNPCLVYRLSNLTVGSGYIILIVRPTLKSEMSPNSQGNALTLDKLRFNSGVARYKSNPEPWAIETWECKQGSLIYSMSIRKRKKISWTTLIPSPHAPSPSVRWTDWFINNCSQKTRYKPQIPVEGLSAISPIAIEFLQLHTKLLIDRVHQNTPFDWLPPSSGRTCKQSLLRQEKCLAPALDQQNFCHSPFHSLADLIWEATIRECILYFRSLL